MRNDFGNPREDLVLLDNSLDVIFHVSGSITLKDGSVFSYYNNSEIYIHKDAFPKLILAIEKARILGYRLKIFDIWRPFESQEKLWQKIPDPNYVSNPYDGPCGHCRGTAIDLTLVSMETNSPLDMVTECDVFTGDSHQDTLNITREQSINRMMLAGIMSVSGFQSIRTEWWHYELSNMYNLYPKYKAEGFINISLF